MGLINKNGMFLYPVEQSFRSYLRHLSTSSYVAWKLLELFATESLWNSMTLSFIAFSQITLSAVLLKNLFNEDGSAWSLFMFGIRIRCMTFQISLLFFEDKIFLKTEFSFLWLLFWFRFFYLCRFSSFYLFGFFAPPALCRQQSLLCYKLLILIPCIQRAGGLVNFVSTRGACLSGWSSVSSNEHTAVNGNVWKSLTKIAKSKFLMNL